ncbi:biopolymer transporter ExbD [Pseudoalteromonas porphyrae]|uniref:ExbD/TolR family protein n=1 Tax=Pseudoalteromonas TaxID=53246 RepID=UPI0006BADF92|nr:MULTISPECIES: biopolymer transporter ExbD [Pseudoalteromonas]KPH94321.1 biopolymer transporter ExbD [Pseudoalteromonas porphyrae]
MSFNVDSDDEDVMNEINMTPLVDVMLVLLIIFIITVPVINQSIELDLPAAKSEKLEVKPKAIVLSVNSEGDYFWAEQAISKKELVERLLIAAQETMQPIVHIRGDKTTQYKNVVFLMEQVQQAGINSMAFITEEKKP